MGGQAKTSYIASESESGINITYLNRKKRRNPSNSLSDEEDDAETLDGKKEHLYSEKIILEAQNS